MILNIGLVMASIPLLGIAIWKAVDWITWIIDVYRTEPLKVAVEYTVLMLMVVMIYISLLLILIGCMLEDGGSGC